MVERRRFRSWISLAGENGDSRNNRGRVRTRNLSFPFWIFLFSLLLLGRDNQHRRQKFFPLAFHQLPKNPGSFFLLQLPSNHGGGRFEDLGWLFYSRIILKLSLDRKGKRNQRTVPLILTARAILNDDKTGDTRDGWKRAVCPVVTSSKGFSKRGEKARRKIFPSSFTRSAGAFRVGRWTLKGLGLGSCSRRQRRGRFFRWPRFPRAIQRGRSSTSPANFRNLPRELC